MTHYLDVVRCGKPLGAIGHFYVCPRPAGHKGLCPATRTTYWRALEREERRAVTVRRTAP